MSKKAYAEREKSLQEYLQRERSQPIQIDPNRMRDIKFMPEEQVMEATKQGNIEMLEKVIKKHGEKALNFHNADGITPLHLSILDENRKVFEFLIHHGADINAGDRGLWTPLQLASNRGDIESVKELLDNPQVDVLTIDIDGKMCLETLTEEPKEAETIKKLFKEYYKKKNIVDEDISKAKEKGEKMLLKAIQEAFAKGYDLNQQNGEGATILHVAVSRGFYDCAEYLLTTCKVNPNISDNDGWTPLHCACCWNRAQFVTLLRKYNADFNRVTLFGEMAQDMTTDPHTLNSIILAKMTHPVNRTRAQERWSKVRTSLRLVILLKDLRAKKVSRLKRNSSLTKKNVQKTDMKRENLTMKNTRMANSVPEEDPNEVSNESTDQKKRRRRRATGQVTGPQLYISGVTDTTIQVSWEEFNADYFKITFEIEGEASSRQTFHSQFTGSLFKLTNLKPNTLYNISVIPAVADSYMFQLESNISVTTSEY